MKYEFLVESYETERVKVLSVWSEFRDEDLPVRPRLDDPRGRSVHEHMVHQCLSEDAWFHAAGDLAHRDPSDDKSVGDERAGQRQGTASAHIKTIMGALREMNTPIQTAPERRHLHVVRIPAEARIPPPGVR